MKNRIHILLVLSVIFFSGRLSAQDQSINGKVYDKETSLPLSGAIVTLVENRQTTSTNVLGEYAFNNLKEGSYNIKVEFIGYKTNTINVTISNGRNAYPVTYLSDNTLTISQIDVTATTDYGEISVSPIDMKLRPTNTAQDLLRLVPGLFIAQHAGGGKAEQIFLRGFDIDHGTDINISVDGMPVNMTSHAHGQGYADLHFVIPETVEAIDIYKGPYYSKFGDLGTSGSVAFTTKNSIEKSMALIEGGKFNSFRGLVMLNILGKNSHLLSKQRENLYVASEYTYSDGYFESKQKFNRINIFGKYHGLLSNNTILSINASYFNSHWDASGQIPNRSVENKTISRFGAIDDNEGGNTNRTNINLTLSNSLSSNSTITNQLYYVRYGFNLYSNFTFFLNDPVNGDMINQKEKRNIYGYKGSFSLMNRSGKTNFITNIGLGARIDDIDTIELSHTKQREFLNNIVAGKIFQTNLFAYVNETIEISDLVINPGLRLDYFNFDFKDGLDNSNSGKKNDIRFGPKLNLFYNVSEKTQLYVKTGIGFHSNDARVVVTENRENTLPKAVGYEAGSSFTLGNALINAGVWVLNLESEFVYVGDEGVVEPSGRTRRLGVDISGRYQFNDWLWADLDLNYAKGKFLDESEDANRIPLAPVLTSIGGLSFRLENGFKGRLGYRFLDDRPANENNSITAKGYFIMDAVLAFTKGNYQLGVTIENLLDNKNWNEAQFDTESRLQPETDPVSELHFTPGAPFNIKGSFSMFF